MIEQPTTMNDLLERDGVLPNAPSIQEETNIPYDGVERPYTLRKLTAKDISPMVKILRRVNLSRLKSLLTSEDLLKVIKKAKENIEENEDDIVENTNSDIENKENNEDDKIKMMLLAGGNVLIEIIPMLLDALDDAIDGINTLLASVANMKKEDVENMELDIYFMLIYDFLNKEEFAGFLKVVSKSINMGK